MRKCSRALDVGRAEVGLRRDVDGLDPVARPQEEDRRLRHRQRGGHGDRQAEPLEHRIDDNSTHARRDRVRHPRQQAGLPGRDRGGARRPARRSCGASGDLVGYGAEPDACVALADAHCTVCLAGNHDLAVVEVLSLDDFSRGAALAAYWTREVIQPETREYLLSLSPQSSAEGVGLFHASPRDPIWEYVLSALAAELCFDATDFRISFIGHSHVALSFHRPEGEAASGDDAARGRGGGPRRPASG